MTEINARSAALECLMAVTDEGRFSHLVLNAAREKYAWLPEEEKALLSRIVHGTLEHLLQIDVILNRYSTVKVPRMKSVVRGVLRMSLYQLLFLDRIPPRAVIFEAVKLTEQRGLRGLKGFVNAVLRNLAAHRGELLAEIRRSGSLSFRYSCPDWIVKKLVREIGKGDAEQVLRAALEPETLYVRMLHRGRNFPADEEPSSKESPEEKRKFREDRARPEELFRESPHCAGIYAVPAGKSREAAALIAEGSAYAQDVSSAIALTAASPAEGETVFDLCASPGGKSVAAADLMGGSGIVRSFDLTEQKVRRIRENAERTGYASVIRAEVSDAAVFRPEFSEQADLVIADLPCSGLGVLGRKPDLKLRLKEEDAAALAALQKKILGCAAAYVKPGGRLLYSTCTISRAENEENRDWFLREHPEFSAPDLTGKLPFLAEGTRRPAEGERPPEDAETGQGGSAAAKTLSAGYLQILPQMFHSDGFFFALFVKDGKRSEN